MNKLIITIVAISIIAAGISGYFFLQKSAMQYEEIQYEDLSKPDSEKSLSCINTFNLEDKEKEFVVNTQEEYKSLFNYKSSYSKCQDFTLPEIDFSQKTLLGKYTSGTGCSIDFVKRVYRDDSNRKIVYSIDVVEEGLCEKLGMSMNWILIPKIPSDYEVEFEVKKVPQEADKNRKNLINANSNVPFQLKINQTAVIESEDLQVNFLNVEDSRCPASVKCIWEGQATVVVNIMKNDQNLGDFSLISRSAHKDLATKVFDGYAIELIKIDPYPMNTQPIELSDYIITLVVTKEEIPRITQQDLERGWYWGSENQKKPGTPSDWIYEEAGRSSCWHRTGIKCGKDIRRKTTNYKDSPFGFLPAIVIPPFEYGISNPYDFATDLGVKWDRSLMFIWMEFQPDLKNEEYQWFLDNHLRYVPNDINLIANILIGSPDPNHSLDPEKYWQYAQKDSFLPKDEQSYVRFVKSLVERYDGDGIDDMPGLRVPIKYWQVDNEPPHGLKDYAEFLKITYNAIKEADPEAKVLIGGVPGMAPASTYLDEFNMHYLPILDELAKMEGRYFDIFDFHWYGEAKGDYREVRDIYEYIQQRLDERGLSPADGYWITEVGTYSGDPVPIRILSDYDYPFQTERQQAVDLLKRYVYPLSLGIGKVFFGFGITEGFKYDEGFFDFTGLIYDGKYKHDKGKGLKKLSYYTYKKMVEVLEGSDWDNIQTIKEEQNDAYGIFLYKFIRNGNPIYVGWYDCFDEQKCSRMKINTQVEIDLGKDINQVKITEVVPRYESGKDVTDYNTAFEAETKSVVDGKITITLGEIPIFVEVKSQNKLLDGQGMEVLRTNSMFYGGIISVRESPLKVVRLEVSSRDSGENL